jgi:hypothetical protein
MVRLLKFLVTGIWHQHKWKILERVPLTTNYGDGYTSRHTRTYCQCEICGVPRTFD